MAEGLVGAGDIQLEVLELICVSGLTVDLTKSCIGITIYEDIFSFALTGTVALGDAFNLPSVGHIHGLEYLRLKIKTPSFPDAPTTAIDFTENVFLVHQISARKRLSEGVQGYTLEFASQELIKNQRKKVTNSLTGTWSNLVHRMLTDKKYLDTSKNILLEKTAGVKRFVSPNIRPLDVVALGTKQAISQEGSEPTFLFYETFSGFHFRSLASMYNDPPSFLFETVKHGTNFPLLNRGRNIIKQMETILGYEISNNNDTILGYRGGMYASKLITHDIINKKYGEHSYKYHDSFSGEPHIVSRNKKREEHPIVSSLFVNREGRISDYTARTFVVPESNNSLDSTKDAQHVTTSNTTPFSNYNPQSWIQRRNSQMLQLENAFCIKLKVHGNTAIRVGDIVTVNIPNVQAASIKKEEEYDKHYSGPFLIKQIRHDFSSVKHVMNISLVKDSLEEPLPSPTNNMEPQRASGFTSEYTYSNIDLRNL